MSYLQAKRLKLGMICVLVASFFTGLTIAITYLLFKDSEYVPVLLLLFSVAGFLFVGVGGFILALWGAFDSFIDPPRVRRSIRKS